MRASIHATSSQYHVSRRRFPDALGQTHDRLFGHATSSQPIFRHTEDQDVPLDRFDRAADTLASGVLLCSQQRGWVLIQPLSRDSAASFKCAIVAGSR